MLTIEIPTKILELVAIAQKGEFPASCWATEIVGEWLFDIAEAHLSMDPEKSKIAIGVAQGLGIEYASFLQAGGDLYRTEATRSLAKALGVEPDKEAFIKVSAMVMVSLFFEADRDGIELAWDDFMPGYARIGQHKASMGETLPMPVWQCLMRYFPND